MFSVGNSSQSINYLPISQNISQLNETEEEESEGEGPLCIYNSTSYTVQLSNITPGQLYTYIIYAGDNISYA